MYYLGQGVLKDPVQTAHWYTLAANQGNLDAQYRLGVMYETGVGVTTNTATASQNGTGKQQNVIMRRQLSV